MLVLHTDNVYIENSMSCAKGGSVAELQLVKSHVKRYNGGIFISVFQMQHLACCCIQSIADLDASQ